MSMLAEVVELVIGVDTHTDTHTAAVVVAATGALVETVTVPADPGGYESLLAVAGRHGGLRAFAVEGAGGYGAGLARHLAAAGEVVVELDRPAGAERCGGGRAGAF
jgi:transposase